MPLRQATIRPEKYLTWRPARGADLEKGLRILHSRFLYDALSQKRLLAFWKHLFKTRSCIAVAVEDRSHPEGSVMAGFWLSFFGTDDFVREAKTTMAPYLPVQAMERWAQGKSAFVPGPDIGEVGREKGLNLVILYFGWDEGRYVPEDGARILQVITESFVGSHCGYPIKEILYEAHGEETRQMALTVGMEPYRDYEGFSKVWEFSSEPDRARPYVMGIQARKALRRVGLFPLNAIFLKPSAPRFRFRPTEQEVLQQALRGESDTEIAVSLDISPWTVKKRWQGIYGKVEKVNLGLLGIPAITGGEPVKRRHHLLDYLRSHPEELRPY